MCSLCQGTRYLRARKMIKNYVIFMFLSRVCSEQIVNYVELELTHGQGNEFDDLKFLEMDCFPGNHVTIGNDDLIVEARDSNNELQLLSPSHPTTAGSQISFKLNISSNTKYKVVIWHRTALDVTLDASPEPIMTFYFKYDSSLFCFMACLFHFGFRCKLLFCQQSGTIF